ncbi:MAG: hypothetical protein V3U87_16910 [Methylococcaceae bacterium]
MVRLAEDLPSVDKVAATKRHYLVMEARALDLSELRQLKPLKRYTLILLLIQSQLQKAAGSRYFCESLFWASQPKQAAKT